NGYGVSIAEAPATWWKRGDVFHTRQIHRGVGASLNAGIMYQCIVRQQQLIAYFVDDWILKSPLDLTPWAELVLEQPDNIGMVRLGPPHPELTGQIRMYKQGWAVSLERHHYAFAMRPALYHGRFFQFYGAFDENCSAIAAERDYNERFCTVNTGPGIVLALPEIWDYSRQPSLSDAIPSDIAREFTQRSS
ncbi:MAG: hypothetical protein L0287_35335, partial [Anaerolineae bacterium]|nr:hypothetical protein [Anaerolineae bacterium]